MAFAAAGGGGPVYVRELAKTGKFLPNAPTLNVHKFEDCFICMEMIGVRLWIWTFRRLMITYWRLRQKIAV